ncbi:MAG: TFIIB-type zinc ribbon-containing protein [Promethearchaeota archaeon]
MKTYRTLQSSSLPLDYSHLECDICGSEDLADTTEGYVCRDCGTVLEVLKLQYDRPYNEEIVQYAPGLGKTQIGTKRERGVSPHSGRLHRLNRQNLITPNKETVNERAKAEISNIFSRLNLNEYTSIKEMVFDKFKQVRPQLRKGVKYRNTEKLVSIISYFCLKLRNVAINVYDLIDNSEITKSEFNDFCYQALVYFPQYAERNRKAYILQRVLEISEHFALGMSFYHLAEDILHKLWIGIKNTTDNVVAGLVSSISLICSRIGRVTVSSICTRLGIRMSTIQTQVKRKIFNKFRVEGFVSLIKSSDLLIKTMEKLGLLEPSPDTEVAASEEHVELVFGTASEVFNSHNEFDYYFFAVRGEYKAPAIITVKFNELKNNSHFRRRSKIKRYNLLDFEVYKYYNSKGPPNVYES